MELTQLTRPILWVDRLSAWDVIWIMLDPSLRRADTLMYRQVTIAGKRWFRRLQKQERLYPRTAQYNVRMGDAPILKGRGMFSAYEERFRHIHRLVCDELWKRYDIATRWYRPKSVSRVRLYLEYQLANEIEGLLKVATYVFWQTEQERVDGLQPNTHVLILSSSKWGWELKPHIEAMGLCVHVIPTIRFVPLPSGLPLGRLVKQLISHMRQAVKLLAKRRRAGSPKGGSQSSGAYKISALYTRSTNLDERNDLFWFKGSGLKSQDVIVCFESPAYPVSDKELARLRNQGFNYVVRNPAAILRGDIPVWSHTSRLSILRAWSAVYLLRLFPCLFKGRQARWQWWQVLKLMEKVNRWQDFFESSNVRIDIRLSYDVARCLALDNLGGVALSVQWSIWHRSHPQLPIEGHVFFCWGRLYTGFMEGAAPPPENLVITGYLFDRYFISAKAEALKIRRSLTEAGAKFVVALFDERPYEEIWSKDMLVRYYTRFLIECLQDQSFGLIIKPKSNDIFEQLNELQPLIERAMATNRCWVLEDECPIRQKIRKNNPIMPVVPSLASDVAVNLISTTGIEAALAGVRSIYYDTLGLRESPFYECNRVGQTVFQDLETLINAIRRHRQTPNGLTGLGDHGAIIDKVDPFRDGRAGERIGTYIRWILEDLNAGHRRKEALANANKRYGCQWGSDKAVMF